MRDFNIYDCVIVKDKGEGLLVHIDKQNNTCTVWLRSAKGLEGLIKSPLADIKLASFN